MSGGHGIMSSDIILGEGGICVRAEERRQAVLKLIEQSEKPGSAAALASRFSVSRQIIVGDIALLRAADVQIFATPRGYMMKPEEKPSGKDYTIACRHRQDQIAQELYAVVDNGGQVLDVIVEHAVYGQISGQLQLSSRYDVDCFVRKLEEMGETDHRAVFIDGTKMESRAGRYTFVWRKSVEKHLAKVKAQVERSTGFTSTQELRAWLEEFAQNITFVHRSGRRKSPGQKEWERLSELLERWEQYENMLSTMGEGRNSYSKTDEDATFMRLKEDHMRNGQLKPAYNVQIGVNSEYITGIELFFDRNDVRTLQPFLKKLEQFHHVRYEEVVADAGYESLENYLYLDSTGQICYIKPTNYEQRRSKKFKKQVGRVENMEYDQEEDCFICAQGRRLFLRRECTAG